MLNRIEREETALRDGQYQERIKQRCLLEPTSFHFLVKSKHLYLSTPTRVMNLIAEPYHQTHQERHHSFR